MIHRGIDQYKHNNCIHGDTLDNCKECKFLKENTCIHCGHLKSEHEFLTDMQGACEGMNTLFEGLDK